MLAGLAFVINFYRKQTKHLYYGGILLIIVGISHALSGTVLPMDPVGSEPTAFGIMHLVLVGVSVLAIFILFPLFGFGLRKMPNLSGLRTYTYVSFLIILISGLASPFVINNEWPIMGLSERVTGYVFYLWLFVISIRYWRSKRAGFSNHKV